MADSKALLVYAARCRRMAGYCATEIVARKLEALAQDYEEHARKLERSPATVETLIEPHKRRSELRAAG